MTLITATATATDRRRLPADERRDTIVAAAARLFAQNGYARTRLEDVAIAAGVTKPIVYRHFESKKALYLALLAKHRADLPGFLAGVEVDLEGGSAEAALRTILERWFAYVAANSHGWEMLFRDSSGDEEIRMFRREVSLRAREVLAGFVASSLAAIPADQVEPTAELLRSGLAGLALWSIDHPEYRRSALVDVAVRACVSALGAYATEP